MYGAAVQLYLLPAAPYFCCHSQPSCFVLQKNQKSFLGLFANLSLYSGVIYDILQPTKGRTPTHHPAPTRKMRTAMDAARYFEEMHLSMSSRSLSTALCSASRSKDLGGADAYLELRQEPVSGKARVFYSTMGRQKLNFQLVRKGWQSCHNASGELTGRFPATATFCWPRRISLFLSGTTPSTAAGWRAFWTFWPILPVVVGRFPLFCPGGCAHHGGAVRGPSRHWSYWSTRAAEQLNIAAILCWLGDYLAGAERRTLQSCRRPCSLPPHGRPRFSLPAPDGPAASACTVPARPPCACGREQYAGRASSPCWRRL